MADDYKDLTRTTRKFILKPDWAKEFEFNFSLAREVQQFVNTDKELYSLSSALGYRIKYGFTNLLKSDEKYILDFFAACQGKLVRFWLPVWENTFKLYQSASMYDEFLLINNVRVSDSFYAHERIFIEFTNGDIITRHILSATGDEGDAYETLTLETPLDRDIAQSDISFFGRYILCRFDIDELKIEAVTSAASACEIDFMELVHEYTAESFES
jgi:hypothetical protein